MKYCLAALTQIVRQKQESFAREVFADGVLFATQDLAGKSMGLYSMLDFMLPYF